MKIAIIKLGAKGDVIRTLLILPAIKEKYPNSEIHWITKKESLELFEANPYVSKAVPIEDEKSFGNFDIVYNFDIDDKACELAEKINAKTKLGFYMNSGYPATYNLGAEYYLNTLFDDELKKQNKKTHQQMIFETAELAYNQHHCPIYLSDKDREYAKDFLKNNNLKTGRILGIHMGSSPRWPSKAWHKEEITKFIIGAKNRGYEIILFGGPDEINSHKILSEELSNKNIKVYKNNPENTLKEFCSLVDLCEKVICSDSLALHVALALKKPTIALFFCTSPNEIEDCNLLKKIVSPRLVEFFPEKMNQYDEQLTKSISAQQVLNLLDEKNQENKKVVNAIIKQGEKFLVIKRKSGLHSGKWAFPGGIVRNSETDEQALKRELEEEVGLKLKNIIKKIREYQYPRENKEITLGKCFLAETENFDVEQNQEVEDFKWVTIEELEKLDHIQGLEEEALLAY